MTLKKLKVFPSKSIDALKLFTPSVWSMQNQQFPRGLLLSSLQALCWVGGGTEEGKLKIYFMKDIDIFY